jgi:hypothetical protein
MTIKTICYEQAVYGSFPFWHRGYGVLARSAGCRPEWLEALRLAARRFGERPTGVAERDGLFALPLRRGPWMIVGVFPQGCDDQGRPGALAFHALFLDRWAYRKAGSNPFAFAPALRREWTESDQDTVLPTGRLTLSGPGRQGHEHEQGLVGEADGRVEAIVAALGRGQKVVIPSPEPIEDLARAVWERLPGRLRRRASVATWAFDHAGHFDLVAVPRLAGITPEPSGLILDAGVTDAERGQPEDLPASMGKPSGPHRRGPGRRVAVMTPIALAGLLAIAAGVGWWGARRIETPPEAEHGIELEVKAGRTAGRDSPPIRKGYEKVLTPDERRRLAEALVDMIEQFCPRDGQGEVRGDSGTEPRLDSPGRGSEPAALMIRLARCLRYSGPSLSAEELKQLEESGDGPGPRWGPDAALALRWHALTRRFLADRPLPAGFAAGPTRWQLAVLAWSFHVDEEPGVIQALTRGVPEETVHALADALEVDVPIPPTSLAGRYPALDRYRRFLGGLPRR